MAFNIPVWIPVVLLIIGVLGIFTRTALAKQLLGIVGTPLGAKADFIGLIAIVVGFSLGGVATITNFVTDFGGVGDVSSDVGTGESIDFTGTISVILHSGLSNTTTTEDFLDVSETTMEVFSADANILDGEEYVWNITIDRTLVAEASTVDITCNLPDKSISGVTADNLAEKTLGQIDMDINDGGRHTDDNTVQRTVSFGIGVTSIEVQIAYDHEEDYHDGLVDNRDTIDTVCIISDSDQSLQTIHRVRADG